MLSIHSIAVSCCLALAAPPSAPGEITGVVVDAADGRPVPGAEVVLRVTIEGRLVPAEQSTADAEGRFRFTDLPVDGGCVYVPGANADGIHYPGRRVWLTSISPQADVRLKICRAVAGPNPLVVRRHEIVLEPKPGSLSVSETMLIENPTQTCYVGRAETESAGTEGAGTEGAGTEGAGTKGTEPVTLRLSIPSNFERATFEKEFYGRRFSLAGGALVTSIPFTPGRRELKFTYVLPTDSRRPVWERPLDLPTEELTLTARTDRPDDMACNLPRRASGPPGDVVFRSGTGPLPAGYVLRVELGKVPFSWRAYGPWLALAMLAGLVAAASLTVLRQRRRNRPAGPRQPVAARQTGEAAPPHHGREARKRRRRNVPSSTRAGRQKRALHPQARNGGSEDRG